MEKDFVFIATAVYGSQTAVLVSLDLRSTAETHYRRSAIVGNRIELGNIHAHTVA